MLDPISYKIEVPCSQEQAFNVFADINSWWPLDKRSMSMKDGQSAKEIQVEPKVGSKIVEISQDGTEYLWGTIKSFDPNDFYSMDFHMGLPAETASLVEVKFTKLEDELTEVELIQSNWEAFGDMAEMMRSGYGSSWGIIFEEAYKKVCSGLSVTP